MPPPLESQARKSREHCFAPPGGMRERTPEPRRASSSTKNLSHRRAHSSDGDRITGRITKRRSRNSPPREFSGDYSCTRSGWTIPLRIADLKDRDDRNAQRVSDVHGSAVVADENITAGDLR